VVTPDLQHTTVLGHVLEAPRPALVEKPAFLSLEDYQTAVSTSRASNTYVQINFQRRFDDLYRSAREGVRSALRVEEKN
jgi:predicted dehydrogenase